MFSNYFTNGKVEPYNLYETQKYSDNSTPFDSRYKYPLLPPVNTNVMNSVIKNDIPFSNPDSGPGNQLVYSGGTNQLIQIPLQYNDPFQPEQLRSQNILITPYNRIKYSTESPSNIP
jgi:hypothetical protein